MERGPMSAPSLWELWVAERESGSQSQPPGWKPQGQTPREINQRDNVAGGGQPALAWTEHRVREEWPRGVSFLSLPVGYYESLLCVSQPHFPHLQTGDSSSTSFTVCCEN